MDIIKLTGENFDEVLSTPTITAAVGFLAEKCGACEMFRKVLAESADDFSDVLFCTVNADNEEELAERFYVCRFPTLIVFNGTEERTRYEGLCGKATLGELLRDRI